MSVVLSECVLLLGCNPADTEFISEALTGLSRPGIVMEGVADLAAGLQRIQQGDVRVVVVGIGEQGDLSAFEHIFSAAPHIPILIVTNAENEQAASGAVECGAHDYTLRKDLRHFRFRRKIYRLILQRAGEEAAFLQQQQAEAVLSCTDEAVVVSDHASRVINLNAAAERLTGWPLSEARGHCVSEVLQLVDTGQPCPVGDGLVASLTDEKYEDLTSNRTLRRRDGVEVAIKHSSALTRDRRGQVTGNVAVFHDVGTASAKTLELFHLAQHDFLTDLPNRVMLNDRIQQAISFADRYRKQLAVMFVDLDFFKKINDMYGHAVGDKLLQAVAGRIISSVRRSDTVSRQGGDEFIVLLSEVTHAEDAVFLARKILNSLSMPYAIDQKHLCVSASIGVSTYPDDGTDAETLIHKADIAVYDAKKLGRNNYQFFRADMQTRVLEWQSLEGSLRNALRNNEFVLHYQPTIDLRTSEIAGVEALLRWRHPERGLVLPGQFVPVAEESGLIVPIGEWVLNEACRQAREWLDAGIPAVRMAVNVSAVQFLATDFFTKVRQALVSSEVVPQNLELELTETVLMRDAESALDTLHSLKALGVQLAVDDFGIGYSSFSYLRKFPLDTLKLDRSFIQDIGLGSDNATILSALINIGKSLHHRVVAEGVETEEQMLYVRSQGCNEGQGYFFCHPMVAERFAQYLESGVKEPIAHSA
jgi:diguanylate cyclase (GGDEF)-like protein/PAS domain S-box-containing protein